jgi:predicted dehydrogenase
MSEEEESMGTLKVGIIGLYRGNGHLRIFQEVIPQTEVVAACDIDEGALRRVAEEAGIRRTYRDHRELLADRDVDAVVVCSPCYQHGAMVLEALHAGKHVLSEVPLTNASVENCFKIVKAAEFTGLKVTMTNQSAWDPRNMAMKQLVREGQIGDVFYGECEYFHDISALFHVPGQAWQSSFRDGFGLHCQESLGAGGGPWVLDTLRQIMDDEFVEVMAYGNRKLAPQRTVNDFEVAIFQTAKGALAKLAISKTIRRPANVYWSVYGTKGSAERDRSSGGFDLRRPEDGFVWFSRDHTAIEKLPVEPHRVPEVLSTIGHGESTYLQDRDFVDAILEDRQPAISVYDAAKTCLAAIAAMQSAKLGHPIKIQSVPDRSAEWPDYREYQRRNRDSRLEQLRLMNDLYASALY